VEQDNTKALGKVIRIDDQVVQDHFGRIVRDMVEIARLVEEGGCQAEVERKRHREAEYEHWRREEDTRWWGVS